MESEELNEMIKEPFKVPDLAELWPEIIQCHKDMGFQFPLTDKEKGGVLTDNEMISEFQWIYGQYSKYIGTKRGPWLSLRGDLSKLIATIKDELNKKSETPSDRTKLVYQTLRNQWLIKSWNHFAWIIEQQKEDENGWS